MQCGEVGLPWPAGYHAVRWPFFGKPIADGVRRFTFVPARDRPVWITAPLCTRRVSPHLTRRRKRADQHSCACTESEGAADHDSFTTFESGARLLELRRISPDAATDPEAHLTLDNVYLDCTTGPPRGVRSFLECLVIS